MKNQYTNSWRNTQMRFDELTRVKGKLPETGPKCKIHNKDMDELR